MLHPKVLTEPVPSLIQLPYVVIYFQPSKITITNQEIENLINKCLDLYKELGVFAQGICIKEEDTHLYIEELIKELTPDIVVITGHDQFDGNNKKDIYSYKNTPNFIKAIKELRKHSSDIVIIAGACASHFEALIASGANIASSPKRINTHTYDPAIAAIKVATTPYDARVDFKYIYK